MGDPGVAKSQLLAYMGNISPRGRFTSGISASAAGLTAAAVQDASADGRWTLEAGALVLADQGLAAIDEFDKMNQADRSSMHEAMEQQTISISKAGINASLRTRCAVLAAANPKAGRFQPVSEVPFTGQINLAPPLISRFDVIWLLTDDQDEVKDAKIAGHIVDNRLSGTSELLVNEGSRPDPRKLSSVRTKPSHTDGHPFTENSFESTLLMRSEPSIQIWMRKRKSTSLSTTFRLENNRGNSKIRSPLLHVRLKRLPGLLKRVHEFAFLRPPASRMLSELSG